MKKLFAIIMCAALCACLAAPCLADLIWTPEDDFAQSHDSDFVDADYEAQSDGDVHASPESDAVIGTVAAGSAVHVYYTWSDWGYIETDDVKGWVALAGLKRLYAEDDFLRDHADEITERDGVVDRTPGEAIYLWTFPGSGQTSGVIDDSFDWADAEPAYQQVFTAADGVQWGQVGYYYGLKGWVCLTDPHADDLPAAAPRYADGTNMPDAVTQPNAQIPVLAIVLVAAVVAVTAVVIAVLCKRRKAPQA